MRFRVRRRRADDARGALAVLFYFHARRRERRRGLRVGALARSLLLSRLRRGLLREDGDEGEREREKQSREALHDAFMPPWMRLQSGGLVGLIPQSEI